MRAQLTSFAPYSVDRKPANWRAGRAEPPGEFAGRQLSLEVFSKTVQTPPQGRLKAVERGECYSMDKRLLALAPFPDGRALLGECLETFHVVFRRI